MLGEICFFNLGYSLSQLPLFLLLPLYCFNVGLERKQVLANLIHPQRLGELGIDTPVVGRSHLSVAGLGYLDFCLYRSQTSQDELLVLQLIFRLKPVVDEGDSHRGYGFCEIELRRGVITFCKVLNSKMLDFLGFERE